jgi:signal transduction histidine kinase
MQQRVLLPLNNSSKTLVSEAEMDQFFKHVLEMTAAETEADGAAVFVPDEKTGQLTVKAGLNIQPENDEAYIRLSEWVMKTARSLVVNDRGEADPYIKQIMSDLGAAGLMSVPLVVREKSIGAINAVMTGEVTRFTHANLEFLSILAKQAAAAIENASLFKSVEKQRQDLEKMLERAVQSQENERKRVAVEIHDGIGQQLVGALYRIQAFNTLLTQHKFEEAGKEAEDIRALLEKTVGELRRVLAGLRPHNLDDLGLVSALRQEAEQFTRETKTECRFNIEGSPVDFTPGQEAAVYRIVQEALTNIRKHARATEAGIELRFQPEYVSVTISDNGRGFKTDRANNSIALGHMGLAGMKERAEMLGAALDIKSGPGKGTSVVLTIPMRKKK